MFLHLSVSHSVHRGRCLTDTPWADQQADTPYPVHAGIHSSPRRPLQRTVRILLECILVTSSWIHVIGRMKSITPVKKKVLLYKAKFYAETIRAQHSRGSSFVWCNTVIHWISLTLRGDISKLTFLHWNCSNDIISPKLGSYCIHTLYFLQSQNVINLSSWALTISLTLIRVLQSHYLPSHLLLIPPNWTAALSLNAPLSNNYQSYPYMAAHFSQVTMGFSVLENIFTYRTPLWTKL